MVKSTALFKQQKRPQRPSFTGDGTIRHDFENKAVETPIEVFEPIPRKRMTSQSQMYTINTMKYINRMTGDEVLHQKPEYFIKPGWIVTN